VKTQRRIQNGIVSDFFVCIILMASISHKKVKEKLMKLSITQQSDILNFLHSNRVNSIGTYTFEKTIGEGMQLVTRIFWKSEAGVS
jgi:hypothetical protein